MMNIKTFTYLFIAILVSSCTERMICPAYQSSFILDEDYRENFFSPFEVSDGDTVPKGYQASASDTVLVATKSFYAQRGSRQPSSKEGFVYPNRKKKFFLTRIWSRPERPVLENPYLFDRIFKKRPYWKLDILKPELIHYSNKDTVALEVPTLLDSLGQAIPDTTQTVTQPYSVLTVPENYNGYNVDQIAYNRKFGHLFPTPPEPMSEEDSAGLFLNMIIDPDSTYSQKRRRLGLFQRKNKKGKKRKGKKRKGNQKDVEGIGAEGLNLGETEEEEAGTDKKVNRKKAKRKNKAKANKKKADKKKDDKSKSKKKDTKKKKKEGNDDGVRDEENPEQP